MPDASSGASSLRRTAAVVGTSAGLLFGLLVVLFGFGPALFIYFCGAVGGGVGWLAYGALNDRLDVAGAWDALRQESSSSSRNGPR